MADMLRVLKRRWRTTTAAARRPTINTNEEEKDELHDLAPPRFIEIKGGKISLGPPNKQFEPDKEVLAARIAELEDALARLQEQVNQSQCESPTIEKDLKDQLENMNRAMKSKDRRAMQALKENKSLQSRFHRQETCLKYLATENQNLHQRIRQYEHCLDDVMRKVVDAIVAEDNLRVEVSMLKNRVRDLEAQNAALSASPAKGRDEGYCTMSSGQPQPCAGHLEDLPEEPEQLMTMLTAEPCSADMEDWSMSQEELGTVLEDDNNESDWPWSTSTQFLNSAVDSQSETISQLLQETIEYSDDEEIGCKDFTRDFYRLVSINSESTRSLQTQLDDSSDTDESTHIDRLSNSPTPSEAGRAQVSSCSSSSESGNDPIELRLPSLPSSDGGATTVAVTVSAATNGVATGYADRSSGRTGQLFGVALSRSKSITCGSTRVNNVDTQSMPTKPPLPYNWRRSTGWRRVSSQQIEPVCGKPPPTTKNLRSPPPVPVRRSYAS